MTSKAVLWDFGGVILSSPFDAFARYERENGLPDGLIRRLNATNPDTNAWAQMERGTVSMAGFGELFEAEARAAGYSIEAARVLALLHGELRPAMVDAVRRCAARIPTGLVTNNFTAPGNVTAARPELEDVMTLFHVIIESSKTGVRKPDPRIYEMACDALGVAATDIVFLDDLGINLKPAREMGMRTIKVTDPDAALDELEDAVGFAVRGT
jgi:putative hydrolase of the HAD superfamily